MHPFLVELIKPPTVLPIALPLLMDFVSTPVIILNNPTIVLKGADIIIL